jgi:acyl-CoA dehydrogenase
VGPENEGWTVAKYLLEFERGGGGAAARLKVGLGELRAIVTCQQNGDGASLLSDPSYAARLAALEIRIMALEFAELSTLARMSSGGSPGPESSLQKNTTVDIGQTMETLLLEAIDYYALPHANLISLNGHDGEWPGPDYAEIVTARYLNGRAASIFGGAKEVQKNIVAKMVLGL